MVTKPKKIIFFQKTKKIEKKIETHPYIYQATVTRQLPNSLNVTYKERKPIK